MPKKKEYLQQIKELKRVFGVKRNGMFRFRISNSSIESRQTRLRNYDQFSQSNFGRFKKEQKETDRHSMIKVQAKELEEKDRIIDRLEETILKLKGDTTLDTKEAQPKKSKSKKRTEPQPEKEPGLNLKKNPKLKRLYLS